MAAPSTPLANLQRWFQAVISHRGGVREGLESSPARDLLAVSPRDLEQVVLPSSRLNAERRLAVYANAYHARLIGCLGETFPVLRRTLGEELFADFAAAYLESHPSRSRSLGDLGRSFPAFLRENRPAEVVRHPGTPDWPDLLVDLATLEWTISEVFDGEGTEGRPTLQVDTLRNLTPETFARSRLRLVPCLRLLELRFPLHDFYTHSRTAIHDEAAALSRAPDVGLPDPRPSWLAVTRRDFVVRRIPLEAAQHALLTALGQDRTVAEALAAVLDQPAPREGELSTAVHRWFREWAAYGLFDELAQEGRDDCRPGSGAAP